MIERETARQARLEREAGCPHESAETISDATNKAPTSVVAICPDCRGSRVYPFLEEGKVIDGRHYHRGPETAWTEVPDPHSKFLKEQS